MRGCILILDDTFAELIDSRGAQIWDSDEDENFEYTFDTDENELIAYLVRAEVVDAERDIAEITDERADALDDDDEADDDDDDDDDDD